MKNKMLISKHTHAVMRTLPYRGRLVTQNKRASTKHRLHSSSRNIDKFVGMRIRGVAVNTKRRRIVAFSPFAHAFFKSLTRISRNVDFEVGVAFFDCNSFDKNA